jgi:hypothetical protein
MQTRSLTPYFKKPVLHETTLLAIICIVDLASTVVLLGLGVAKEANPVLQPFVAMGIPAFIGAKLLYSIGPLTLLEIIRTWRPNLVKWALRAGVVGYLSTYVIGTLRIHGWI